MEGSNAQNLKRIIVLAVEDSPTSTDMDLARQIQEANPSLVAVWALERLSEQIRGARKRHRAPDPYQTLLEGYQGLRDWLPVRGGRMTLVGATIMDLRRSLKLDRDKVSVAAQRKMKLIEKMEPYAKVQRGITVGRYCELVAAGVPARLAKGPRQAQHLDSDSFA